MELTIAADDLAALLGRIREEAEGSRDSIVRERRSASGRDPVEEREATIRACEAVFVYLDAGAEGGEAR